MADIVLNPTAEEPPTPGIEWVAAWGDQVREGDLIRLVKLGGPVRVVSLRRMTQHPGAENGPWFWGGIVSDRENKQYHVFIQPHEAVWLAVDVPIAGIEDVQPGVEDS